MQVQIKLQKTVERTYLDLNKQNARYLSMF